MASLLSLGIFAVNAAADTREKYTDPVFVEPGLQRIETTDPKAYKILFVGNSITRHGVYKEIGWEHEAGMAASAEKNDYAHQTVALLQKEMPERKVEFYYGNVNLLINAPEPVKNVATVFGEKMPKPDLIIIQTGEHEGPKKSAAEVGELYEMKIIRPLAALKVPMLAVGVWYPTENQPYPDWVKRIDAVYREICGKYGIAFASVEMYARNPACRNFGSHPAVKWHPSDAGMTGYANEILKMFQKMELKHEH